jgi:hypothetical protein
MFTTRTPRTPKDAAISRMGATKPRGADQCIPQSFHLFSCRSLADSPRRAPASSMSTTTEYIEIFDSADECDSEPEISELAIGMGDIALVNGRDN